MQEIKQGQILYEQVRGEIVPHTVAKVGRKYFYLEGDTWKDAFDINTLFYNDKNYSQRNRLLHLSRQELVDKNELQENREKVRDYFNGWSNKILDRLTNHQLTRIIGIVNEKG